MADELAQKLKQLIEEDLQTAPAAASIEQLVEHLQQDKRFGQVIQNNSGDAVGFQALVEDGGVANMGIHLHGLDEEKLTKALQLFLKSLQPKEIR
jgi:hypothetical protein